MDRNILIDDNYLEMNIDDCDYYKVMTFKQANLEHLRDKFSFIEIMENNKEMFFCELRDTFDTAYCKYSDYNAEPYFNLFR